MKEQKQWLDKTEARLLGKGELKHLQELYNVNKEYAVKVMYGKRYYKRTDVKQIKAAEVCVPQTSSDVPMS